MWSFFRETKTERVYHQQTDRMKNVKEVLWVIDKHHRWNLYTQWDEEEQNAKHVVELKSSLLF